MPSSAGTIGRVGLLLQAAAMRLLRARRSSWLVAVVSGLVLAGALTFPRPAEPSFAPAKLSQPQGSRGAPAAVAEPELLTPLEGQVGLRMDPLLGVSNSEIGRLVKEDPASLGSLSVGLPNRGLLINGVAMQCSTACRVIDPDKTFGTAETVAFVRHGIARLRQERPGTHPVFVGHMSKRHGGYLRPHRSHQSGRDVDLGYIYSHDAKWYAVANEQNLDARSTWLLLQVLITETDVEFIFLDHSIEELLRTEALRQGADPEWVARIFDGTPGAKDALIRHVWGHRTHMHIRFRNPIAEQNAVRSLDFLEQTGRVPRWRFYSRQRR